MGVKKTIARNMMNSLQTMAQNTCTLEVDCTDLLALREKYVADQEMLGCKITVNDLLCKMLGKVVAKHPLANATFDGKTLYSHKHVHLSVAVATEDGLMVPVSATSTPSPSRRSTPRSRIWPSGPRRKSWTAAR